MTARIRCAVPADAEAITDAHIPAWQAAYAGQLPADFLTGMSKRRDRRIEIWRRLLGDASVTRSEPVPDERYRHTTLVAGEEGAGELSGFVTYGESRDDDPFPSSSPTTGTGELWAINLHPDAWGRGIGSALFRAAVDGLADMGFSRATLWVLATNARARRFYEKHGWQPDGVTKTEHRGDVPLHVVRYSCDLADRHGAASEPVDHATHR